MSRSNADDSNYNSALCAVYGSSLGLIALLGRNFNFRAMSALAGAGLLLCAAVSRKSPRVAARTRSRRMDEALEQSFPASDPPASRLPDVPPSNAEAKWKAYLDAKNDTEGV